MISSLTAALHITPCQFCTRHSSKQDPTSLPTSEPSSSPSSQPTSPPTSPPTIDIDECANSNLNTCHTDATCTNLPDGYSCACNEGFTGDGSSCTDINECDENTHGCSAGYRCENTHGGHDCIMITAAPTTNPTVR